MLTSVTAAFFMIPNINWHFIIPPFTDDKLSYYGIKFAYNCKISHNRQIIGNNRQKMMQVSDNIQDHIITGKSTSEIIYRKASPFSIIHFY